MLKALTSALVAFGVSIVLLMGIGWLLQSVITPGRKRTYKWGVWIFSLLIAGYFFLNGLGG